MDKKSSEELLKEADNMFSMDKFPEALVLYNQYLGYFPYMPSKKQNSLLRDEKHGILDNPRTFENYIASLLKSTYSNYSLSKNFYLYRSYYEGFTKFLDRPIATNMIEIKSPALEFKDEGEKGSHTIFRKHTVRETAASESLFHQKYFNFNTYDKKPRHKYLSNYSLFFQNGKFHYTSINEFPREYEAPTISVSADELLLKIINEKNLIISPRFFVYEILRESDLYKVAILFNTIKYHLLFEEHIIGKYYCDLANQSIKNGEVKKAYDCLKLMSVLGIYFHQLEPEFFRLYLEHNGVLLEDISQTDLFKKYENIFSDFKIFCEKTNVPKAERLEAFSEQHYMGKRVLNFLTLELFYPHADDFKFGKYKDERIEKVIEKDPEYVIWCIVNLNRFCIPSDSFINYDLLYRKDSDRALEINLVKIELSYKWETVLYDLIYDNYNTNSGEGYDWDNTPSYDDWLKSEFDDKAGDAYWNID